MRPPVLRALALFAGATALCVSACSSGAEQHASPEVVGAVGLELQLVPGVTLNSLSHFSGRTTTSFDSHTIVRGSIPCGAFF